MAKKNRDVDKKSIVSHCYKIMKAMPETELLSAQTVSDLIAGDDGERIHKNTINYHAKEMEHLGLAEVRPGKYGGVRLIKQILINRIEVNDEEIELIVIGLTLQDQSALHKALIAKFAKATEKRHLTGG